MLANDSENLITSNDVCEDCGAVVAEGKAGCLEVFEEILAREFSDYPYGKIHRLTVDTYSLHHQGEQTRAPEAATTIPPATNQIFKPEEVTRKAVLVWMPVAPFMQVRHDVNFSHGVIKLQMVLSATGRITDIKVLQGLTQGMNKKVIEAVKYFKFIPAKKDGGS